MDVEIGKKFVVDKSLDHRRISGNYIDTSPPLPIAFLGTIVNFIAPVLLTVAGSKVTEHDVN